MNAVARLNFHFLYILTSTHPSSASRDNKVVATPYYYSKYTVNWNALSHSEINKTELFKLKVLVKFIYSEKATKFCEIFTFLMSYVSPVKSKVKIL